MENQPPLTTGRQWFRLASLARMEALGQAPPAPAPAPAPQPAQAPPVPRIPRPASEPTITQPFIAQPPPQRAANGAPPPLPAESPQPPITQVIKSSPPQSPISKMPTPPASPRVIKPSIPTPPESPKIRQLQPIKAPPPSPYPEPEPEPKAPLPAAPSPKSMLMQQGGGNSYVNDIISQKSIVKNRSNDHNGKVKNLSDINEKPKVVSNKESHATDARGLPPPPKKETSANGTGTATRWKKDEDGEVKVITIAGDNAGAFMELGSSDGRHRRNKQQQQQHGYQLKHQIEGSESQGEDGIFSGDKKKDKGKKAGTEGKPTAALVNSNVQSVNNSIIFRSYCTQQSPGVHMSIVARRKPKH